MKSTIKRTSRPTSLPSIFRAIAEHPGRAAGVALVAGALAIGASTVHESAQSAVENQNLAASKKVESYVLGTLRIGRGVNIYLAPDTQGKHLIDGGTRVDGDEIPNGSVQNPLIIANPVKYIDPDGTPWLGFTPKGGAQEWIKQAVIGQKNDEGGLYASWTGGRTPDSIDSVVLRDGVFIDPAMPEKGGAAFMLGTEVVGQ